jgi:dipeptidase E
MKLYLSSIEIPMPDDLAQLLGKPLNMVSIAMIPNAKDYYSKRARALILEQRTSYFESLGLTATIVDLREFHQPEKLVSRLKGFDLIWGMGGNTYILRYEMKRSGFDAAIKELLKLGIVYGGESAGALVAGDSLDGINLESADEPGFAEEIVREGLKLVPYTIVPHADNPEFRSIMNAVASRPDRHDKIIELTDAQAVIFKNADYRIVGR